MMINYGRCCNVPRKNGLTKKEKAFCEAYVFDSESATGAYMKAYDCAYKTANAQGWKVLRKPLIQEYINTLQKEAFAAACITAEKVALKLSEIAFAEKGDKDYNTTAQLKALDLLQKQLGLQKQHIDADLHTDINITIE